MVSWPLRHRLSVKLLLCSSTAQPSLPAPHRVWWHSDSDLIEDFGQNLGAKFVILTSFFWAHLCLLAFLVYFSGSIPPSLVTPLGLLCHLVPYMCSYQEAQSWPSVAINSVLGGVCKALVVDGECGYGAWNVSDWVDGWVGFWLRNLCCPELGSSRLWLTIEVKLERKNIQHTSEKYDYGSLVTNGCAHVCACVHVCSVMG